MLQIHHQIPGGGSGGGGGGGGARSNSNNNNNQVQQWQPQMYANAAASSGFPSQPQTTSFMRSSPQQNWLHKNGIHPLIRPNS